jgi:small subunit ribosomal protein S9
MADEETTTPTQRPGRYVHATGRRKEAVARVRLYEGSGTIEINGKPYLELFSRNIHQIKVRKPLEIAGMQSKFDIVALIDGGGISAWADALAHGTARALLKHDESLRKDLRAAGFLTRDPRVKERKKVGLKRARKAPQYTKR